MCFACDDDYAPDYDEFDDEDEEITDEELAEIREQAELKARAAEMSAGNSSMSLDDKMEFIGLLLRDDAGALITVEAFLEAMRTPLVTEVSHTLWTGQQDGNGFYVYHVTHNLGTEEVVVSLDTNDLYSYAVKDKNTIAIVCPEKLWGVDVEVRVRGM